MHSRLGRVGWLGLALLALASVLVPATATASDHKRYSVGVPAKALPSALQHFTITVKNEAVDQSLGSADLTSPFTVVQGSATSSVGSVTTEGSVLKLRELNLPPGKSLTVKFDATTPDTGSDCESKTYTWGAQAKQANDFRGTGNDFTLSNGPLETLVACQDTSSGGECAADETCARTITYSQESTAVQLVTTLDEGALAGPFTADFESLPGHGCKTQKTPAPISGIVVGPDGRNKTVELRLSPAIVEASGGSPQQLLAGLEICGAVPVTPWLFEADQTTFQRGLVPWFQGLIGDCGSGLEAPYTAFRPCVDRAASHIDETGNYVLKAHIPGIPGDPAYR